MILMIESVGLGTLVIDVDFLERQTYFIVYRGRLTSQNIRMEIVGGLGSRVYG